MSLRGISRIKLGSEREVVLHQIYAGNKGISIPDHGSIRFGVQVIGSLVLRAAPTSSTVTIVLYPDQVSSALDPPKSVNVPDQEPYIKSYMEAFPVAWYSRP